MSTASWINMINGLTDAYQWSATTLKELKAGQNKYGLVQKYQGSANDDEGFFYTPVYKTIGKATSSTGGTANTESLMAHVRIRATNSYGKIITQAFVGRAMDATRENMVKGGTLIVPQYQVVASVAQACGRSIGWGIARSITGWLNSENDDGTGGPFDKGKFDWGPSAITGSDGIACFGRTASNNVTYYIEYNLFNRLCIALNRWGLWDIDPGSYVPSEPVMNESVTYDFRGRFPNIPDKYVEQVEALINDMINPNHQTEVNWPEITPLANQYIMVAINRNESLMVTIWDDPKQIWEYRSPKMNGEGTFQYYEEEEERISRLRFDTFGLAYGYPFAIFASGNFGKFNRREAYRTVNFVWGDSILAPKQPGIIYDNFGTYRPIINDNGKIRLGAPTNDLSQVVIDENAIDLREHPIDSPESVPNVWSNRIYISTPDFDQPMREYPSASDLNFDMPYIQLKMVDAEIDPNATQNDGFFGLTSTTISDEVIDKTPGYSPNIGADPSPLPITPPSELPNPPVLPVGINSAGLVHLYKIDLVNVKNLGQALWTTNVFDNFIKMFSNPMDAIISLKQIYLLPESAASQSDPVVVGNLTFDGTLGTSTEVNAMLIEQYKELNCGTMYIKPYFKNINDITGTTIQLYLPFIGFVTIDPKDVIYMNDFGTITGKYLSVKYYIDFLTGACLACVSTKESIAGDDDYLYTFSGNCSVEVPLSGASYANIIRNVISAGFGIASTSMASMGMHSIVDEGDAALAQQSMQMSADTNMSLAKIGGAKQIVTSSNVPIQRSGNCGSNIGAMGPRKPYLIITRRKSFDADNRRHFEGLPQNRNVKLGAMQGYTRVKFINLEGLTCTEEEKADILAKLQGGVFI